LGESLVENSSIGEETCRPGPAANVPGHGKIQIVGLAGTCQMNMANYNGHDFVHAGPAFHVACCISYLIPSRLAASHF
jgi:hypothetical protein